jgi:hypothetical protein
MTMLQSFVLSLVGFASLAFAMDRHQHRFWSDALPTWLRWGLRSLGVGLLVVSLWARALSSSWSVGFVEWVGFLTAAATCVVLGLTYGPRVSRIGKTQHRLHTRKR